MADDVTDYYTTWYSLADHVACPNIENLRACFQIHVGFDRYYNRHIGAFDTRIQNAFDSWVATDDHAAIGDLIMCCRNLSDMVNIVHGAAMDCRILLLDLDLSKERVFDLWLERASEMPT